MPLSRVRLVNLALRNSYVMRKSSGVNTAEGLARDQIVFGQITAICKTCGKETGQWNYSDWRLRLERSAWLQAWWER